MKLFEIESLDIESSVFGRPLPPVGDGPIRIVLDSTDTGTLAAAMTNYEKTLSFPTLTLDPESRRVLQHVTEGMAPQVKSRDLHAPWRWGRTIWVNIVKQTAEDLSEEALLWVAGAVDALATHFDVPLTNVVSTSPADTSYKLREMDWKSWVEFSGVCSAQAVPLSGRFGPGQMDMIFTVEEVVEEPVEEEGLDVWADESPSFSGRTLALGSKGKQINALRSELGMVEGDFDEMLKAKVLVAQSRWGLEETGKIDRDTWDALLSDEPEEELSGEEE